MLDSGTCPLYVILPVYNEEASIAKVVEEWIPVLIRDVGHDEFVFLALNDGSKDGTLNILRRLNNRFKQLRIVDKPNTGHGQTCIEGYRIATTEGAEWVLQIDSDGQCDPRFFGEFWRVRFEHDCIMGLRASRDDGFKRIFISRFVSIFSFIATGVWVWDANVPYRLMRTRTLKTFLKDFPRDFHLANILISILLKKYVGIKWIKIHFRDRFGGSPSIKSYSFVKQGIRLFSSLRKFRS